MAPVARGISDRQEDRAVLTSRSLEGLLTPRIPVDGIVCMLEEVRTALTRKAVRHGNPQALCAQSRAGSGGTDVTAHLCVRGGELNSPEEDDGGHVDPQKKHDNGGDVAVDVRPSRRVAHK